MDLNWKTYFQSIWKWEEYQWNADAVFTCQVHSKLLWVWCATCYHAEWRLNDIGRPFTILEIWSIIQSLLGRIKWNSQTFELNCKYPGYNDCLEVLIIEFEKLKDLVSHSTKNKDFEQLKFLIWQAFEFKVKIDCSYWFTWFSAFSVNRYEASKTQNVIFDFEQKAQIDQYLINAKATLLDEITKQKEAEVAMIEERAKIEYNRMVEQTMKDILVENEQFKHQLNDKLTANDKLQAQN